MKVLSQEWTLPNLQQASLAALRGVTCEEGTNFASPSVQQTYAQGVLSVFPGDDRVLRKMLEITRRVGEDELNLSSEVAVESNGRMLAGQIYSVFPHGWSS